MRDRPSVGGRATVVLASAADRRYGWWLLNMLGSVHANAPQTFDGIVVYDLGLSSLQRRLVDAIRGVEVRTVPPFVPHWREGRTWKTWIWRHLNADRVVWLDAGLTVLRPLDEALTQLDRDGYWVVSQGHAVEDVVPSDYYSLLDFPRERADRPVVAAGVLGFDRGGAFFERVIVPTYEDAVAGRSRGASEPELAIYDVGLDRMSELVVRDCRLFRHEQTLLNVHLYRWQPDPVIFELDRWAGRGPRDHPGQVIWAHRRSGDHRYLASPPAAPFAKAVLAAYRARWWLRLHRWLFRPSTYTGKLGGLVAGRRG